MTNYNDLLSDVQAWLDNDEHVARIPGWIRLAEEEHANTLRLASMLAPMERPTSVSGSPNATIPIPDSYLDTAVLKRAEPGAKPLDSMGLANLEMDRNSNATGYAVTATDLVLDTIGEDSFYHWYYKPLPPVTEQNQTNWLIINQYSVYLFGALRQGGDFVADDEKMAVWEAKYAGAMTSARQRDQRHRFSEKKRTRMDYGEWTP